jgi:hypothetical protein
MDPITASEPSVFGGELDPEDTAKISRPESNGLVSWVELFDPRGDVGGQDLPMARQAEMLNENRLRVPRPAVRKRHGPWRAIRGAGDVGVQEGTDPFGGSIRGIAKAMARAPEADAVPGQSALDLGSPQLTSSDRFGRSSSEPLTKRLLKVVLGMSQIQLIF